MDVFPSTCISDGVKLIYNIDHWERAARRHKVQAFIPYMEIRRSHRIFYSHKKTKWIHEHFDNFYRSLQAVQHCGNFNPRVKWEKIQKKLMRSPKRNLKNADIRLCFQWDNMFLVKSGFTFGYRRVETGTKHIFQLKHVPLICYRLAEDSEDCCTRQGSFNPSDQPLYDQYEFRPHGIYTIPAGTRYLVIAVQKTLFSVCVVHENNTIPRAQHFETHKCLEQETYTSPPPTPNHEPEDQQRVMDLNISQLPRCKPSSFASKTSSANKPPFRKRIMRTESTSEESDSKASCSTRLSPIESKHESSKIHESSVPHTQEYEEQDMPDQIENSDTSLMSEALLMSFGFHPPSTSQLSTPVMLTYTEKSTEQESNQQPVEEQSQQQSMPTLGEFLEQPLFFEDFIQEGSIHTVPEEPFQRLPSSAFPNLSETREFMHQDSTHQPINLESLMHNFLTESEKEELEKYVKLQEPLDLRLNTISSVHTKKSAINFIKPLNLSFKSNIGRPQS